MGSVIHSTQEARTRLIREGEADFEFVKQVFSVNMIFLQIPEMLHFKYPPSKREILSEIGKTHFRGKIDFPIIHDIACDISDSTTTPLPPY